MPIVVGALGTVAKRLKKGLEQIEISGRIEIIQTTALLRSARILSRVLKTCCYSVSTVRSPAKADVKNLLEIYIFIIIIIIIIMRVFTSSVS